LAHGIYAIVISLHDGVYPYNPAYIFNASFLKILVSSLFEANESKLQGSGMAILKKIGEDPRGHLFRKNRLHSDFNVEVEGVDVEVVK
jgi:hypothetical protein